MARASPDKDLLSIDRFQDHLQRLEGQLNRYLIDEEDLVVPLLLKYGFGNLR